MVPLGTWGSGGMTASGTWNNPNMYVNTRGRLDLDKPHELKFSGVYYAPYGFILGVNYIGQSGTPYARTLQREPQPGHHSLQRRDPGSTEDSLPAHDRHPSREKVLRGPPPAEHLLRGLQPPQLQHGHRERAAFGTARPTSRSRRSSRRGPSGWESASASKHRHY